MKRPSQKGCCQVQHTFESGRASPTLTFTYLFPILGILLTLFGVTGCVNSKCFQNADCPEGRICLDDGTCTVPECQSNSECSEENVCSSNQCVPGCRTDENCETGMLCFNNQCVEQSECDCPKAPEFCHPDLNPNSPTFNQTVCLNDSFEQGAALFFGSLGCSHCQVLFEKLVQIQQDLQTEQLHPALVFVQLEDRPVTIEDVGRLMETPSAIVIQDDLESLIWETYQADWYHLVVVDQNGCQAEHLGPLSAEDENWAEIPQIWLDAMEAECPNNSEEVEPEEIEDDNTAEDLLDELDILDDSRQEETEINEPDSENDTQSAQDSQETQETYPDEDEDIFDTSHQDSLEISEIDTPDEPDVAEADTEEIFDTNIEPDTEDEPDVEDEQDVEDEPDVEDEQDAEDEPDIENEPEEEVEPDLEDEQDAEVEPDIEDEQDAEDEPDTEDTEPDTGPLVLDDLCQVVETEPLELNGQVPHFLCRDHNPNSPNFGQAASDVILQEQIWIAYFASCT